MRNKIINIRGRLAKKYFALCVFALVIIVLFGNVFLKKIFPLSGTKMAFIGHDKHVEKRLPPLMVLVLGEFKGNTDTIMVFKYDVQLNKASILSIPRDTFVGENIKNATPWNKINALYSHRFVRRFFYVISKITKQDIQCNGTNLKRILNVVNNMTGLYIQNYILIDREGLVKLVDSIGGIQFDVPMAIDLDGLHLNAGPQRLNGEQVVQLSRFRHNEDGRTYPAVYGIQDFGRMHTQRDLMKAFAQEIIQRKNIVEMIKILDVFRKNVRTNLDFSALKDYLPSLIQINPEQIKLAQLPGESNSTKNEKGLWFFIMDAEKTKTLINYL